MHLQLLTEQGIRRGMSPEEARLGRTPSIWQYDSVAATPAGDGLDYVSRQSRTRSALRCAPAPPQPILTIIAIISLALGIGANTAIFTVAKKVLLDSLPVKNPQELRMLTWVSGHEQPVPPVWGDVGSTEGGGLRSTAFSYPVLEELRKKTEVFEDLIAFKPTSR